MGRVLDIWNETPGFLLGAVNIRFIKTFRITRKIKPFGVAGGEAGECGREWLEKKNGTIVELQGNDCCEVEEEDLFIMLTPSGGGFGKK